LFNFVRRSPITKSSTTEDTEDAEGLFHWPPFGRHTERHLTKGAKDKQWYGDRRPATSAACRPLRGPIASLGKLRGLRAGKRRLRALCVPYVIK